MAFLRKIFEKSQPGLPTISRPLRHSTTDKLVLKSNYHKEWNGKSSQTSWASPLPPCTSPPPGRRLLLLTCALSSVCSVTAIILFSIVIPLWDRNFVHSRSLLKGDWTDGLLLAPLSLSLLFSTYLLVASLSPPRQHQSHRQNQSAQPFYRLLLCTTLLVILVPTLILSSSNSLALAFRVTDSPTSHNQPSKTNNGLQICTLSNILTRPCLPVLYRIGELQIGAIVLTSLVAILWLVVLISSLKSGMQIRAEERRRREQRRRQKRKDRAKGTEYTHSKVRSHDAGSTTTMARGKDSLGGSVSDIRQESNAVRYTRHQLKLKTRM